MMKTKLLMITLLCGSIAGCLNTGKKPSVEVQSKQEIHNSMQHLMQTFADTPIMDEGIASLRGIHSLRKDSAAPTEKKWVTAGDFDASFDSQPPLVPHKSEHMRVTMDSNRCLDCHSNANYKEEESAKMPASHFKTRSGKRLKTVSPRRYFCQQCHVSQIDAKPLIENTYVNTDE
ncbi:MAG: nitrate reductase cytochrome c-type subunit; periplasmic nitrate reductase electron transfer subunit [Gammaproteobacteria bacterium]|nr:nitrate reductase cytochrome c-type subunit; periplasmic nitrate reductase electron transfer subunit [Gammaproteobacteria bacterium]